MSNQGKVGPAQRGNAPTAPESKSRAAAAAGSDPSQPLFPPQRAFVVQFSKEADAAHGQYVGRVEHVVSGQSARFADAKELLKIITAELGRLAGSAAAASAEPQGDQNGEDERD